MSGGRFDHLWYKVTDDEKIFATFDNLRDCEEFLRSYGQQFAADEILRYRLELETRYHQLLVMGERLEPLLYAAEWWASGDWSKDQFEQAWKEYMGDDGKEKE